MTTKSWSKNTGESPLEEVPVLATASNSNSRNQSMSPGSKKRVHSEVSVEADNQQQQAPLFANDEEQQENLNYEGPGMILDDLVCKVKYDASTLYSYNVLLMDLDSHNFAHSFLSANDAEVADLVNNNVIEKRPFFLKEAGADITKNLVVKGFEEEVLSNEMFFFALETDGMHSWPVRTRLWIAAACLALTEVESLLIKLSGPDRVTSETDIDKYHECHIRARFAYQGLMDFLLSGSLLANDFEKAVPIFCKYKLMIFCHDLLGFKRTSDGYVAYLQDEAVSMLRRRLSLTASEERCIPARLLRDIQEKLDAYVAEFSTFITEGGFSMPKASNENAALCALMKNSLKQADSIQWPIFMSEFDIRATPSLKKAATKNLEATRNSRGPGQLDRLGVRKLGNAVVLAAALPVTRPSTQITGVKTSKRVKWSVEQDQALEEGLLRHHTKWSKILEEYADSGIFDGRDQVALKDRARNIRRKRERENLDLGIFRLL